MRPSRFTDDQIVEALRQVSGGTPAIQVCRALGITETTFYRWRKTHAAAPVSESRAVRALREENHRLKEIVADLVLQNQKLIAQHRRR